MKDFYNPTACYVDDSVHSSLRFLVLAFVFATEPLDQTVSEALGLVGLSSEFKSGTRMDGNPTMRAAREALVEIARTRTRIAAMVTDAPVRGSLGKQALQALQSILVRNGIRPEGIQVYCDQGIFKYQQQAVRLQSYFSYLSSCAVFGKEDSRTRCGVQIADLVAHSFAQVVREAITGEVKLISPEGGPANDRSGRDEFALTDLLLHPIRYSILARKLVSAGDDFDPATDPVVLEPDDDPTQYGVQPELLGWGVQVSPESSGRLQAAVNKGLNRLWRGCLH